MFRCLNPREGTETIAILNKRIAAQMFRCLNPREGTETKKYGRINHFRCSDALIPERGRKRNIPFRLVPCNPLFRCLNPREGTETRLGQKILQKVFRSDALIPERGRKQSLLDL